MQFTPPFLWDDSIQKSVQLNKYSTDKNKKAYKGTAFFGNFKISAVKNAIFFDNHPKSAFERDDIANIGGVTRRKVFALTYLLDISSRDLYGQRNRPFSILAVDLVNNLLQSVVSQAISVVEERLLNPRIGRDGEADDARSFERISWSKILPEMADYIADELGGVARRCGQGDGAMEEADGLIQTKTRGLRKEENLLANGVLLPEFACAGRHKIRQAFLEHAPVRNGLCKRAGLGNRLLGLHFGEGDFVVAVEFTPCTPTREVEEIAHKHLIKLRKIEGSSEPQLLAFLHGSPAYSPHVFERKKGKCFLALFATDDAASALVAGVFLGEFGGHLGERFGRSNPYRNGNANAFLNLLYELLAIVFLFGFCHMVEQEKRLVDGVLIEPLRMSRKDAHHAVGKVAIEGEIRGETDYAILFHKVLYFKKRNAHFYAQLLNFVTTRHHTSIVAAQYDHRALLQIGPKHPFAGHEEIIAIHERVHFLLFLSILFFGMMGAFLPFEPPFCLHVSITHLTCI